jgi:transposase
LNPPDHAIVLAVDERSQIQALSRTQPVLPMGLGYVEGVTHDYVRHGNTTLFAALDIAPGTVFTDCKPRHRHQEFLSFLKRIDGAVPQPLDVHLIVDNYDLDRDFTVMPNPQLRSLLKRIFTMALLSSLSLPAFAQTCTAGMPVRPNMGLCVPPYGNQIWQIPVNTSRGKLETQFFNTLRLNVTATQTMQGPLAWGTQSAIQQTQTNLGTGYASVVAYGALGNDSTDAYPSIQACINASTASGGQNTCYIPNGIYRLSHQLDVHSSTKLICQSSQAVLKINASIHPTNDWISITPVFNLTIPLSGAFTAGQTQFTLSSVAGLSVRQDVFLYLGQDPYDSTQNYTRMYDQITNITGNVVTLAVPLPENVAAPTIRTSSLNTFTSEPQNIEIGGCGFDMVTGSNPDVTIQMEASRNVYLHDLTGIHIRSGMIDVDNSENVNTVNTYVVFAEDVSGSGGVGMGGWGSRNVSFKNFYCMNCEREFAYFESQMRGVTIENAYWSADNKHSAEAAIAFYGNSQSNVVDGFTYNPQTANVSIIGAQGSTFTSSNVTFTGASNLSAFFPQYHNGPLNFYGQAFNQTQTVTIPVQLLPNQTGGVVINLPSGIYKDILVYTSTTTGLNTFYFLNGSAGADVHTELIAGKTVDLAAASGPGVNLFTIGTFTGFNYPLNGKTLVYHSNGTLPAGSLAIVTITYYPDPANQYTTPSNQTGVPPALRGGSSGFKLQNAETNIPTLRRETIDSHTVQAECSAYHPASRKNSCSSERRLTKVLRPSILPGIAMVLRRLIIAKCSSALL